MLACVSDRKTKQDIILVAWVCCEPGILIVFYNHILTASVVSSMEEMYASNDSIGFLTYRISYLLKKDLERQFELGKIPVSAEEYPILVYLWDRDAKTQAEIAGKIGKDRPRITRLLDRLEHAGLVQRIQKPNDRREKLVVLTKEGKKLEKLAKREALKTLDHAFGWADDEQMEQINRFMRKAILAMESIHG